MSTVVISSLAKRLSRVVSRSRVLSYAMPYETIQNGPEGPKHRVVDLRSDTVSKPTPEMKEAMMTAEIGDDVYGEDPTVAALEREASGLLGKESGLFVPTGTMGNLIASKLDLCERWRSQLLQLWCTATRGGAR